MPAHLKFIYLVILIIWWILHIMEFLIMQFSPVPCHFIPLGVIIFVSSQTPSVFVLTSVWDTKIYVVFSVLTSRQTSLLSAQTRNWQIMSTGPMKLYTIALYLTLLLHILQKIYPNKSCTFFRRSITAHHLIFLRDTDVDFTSKFRFARFYIHQEWELKRSYWGG